MKELIKQIRQYTGLSQTGIDLANKICKSHRREGKFFDEILDEAIKGDK